MSKGKKHFSRFLIVTFLLGFFMNLSVTSNAAVNLALNKPAVATSVENASLAASKAVDGSTSTRWASAASDPQSLTIDLQGTFILSGVKLNWEAAYASDYKIQVSLDNSTWIDAYSEVNGPGKIETIQFSSPVKGKYIRMLGTKRKTTYGYSLYEFEVYGSSEKLEAPVLTPGEGVYSLGQAITMEDAYAGTSIRYTTDGTTPTATHGALYTGSIALTDSMTLKAVAFTTSGECSEVTTASYVLNLAYRKAATASSVSGSNTAANAFDGNTGTRWESKQGSDNEWITVDLGMNYLIRGAVLNWETAAASDYTLQISSDNSNWKTAYSEIGGSGGIEKISFSPVYGRYVKMAGTKRTTPYGYSLYEFSVIGRDITGTVSTPVITPGEGMYGGAQTISINCDTPGAAIFYTVDGTTPSAGSPGTLTYGTSFTISSTTTVKALAVKAGLPDSDISYSTIRILKPPTGFAADSITPYTVNLHWTAITGASYNLYRSTAVDNPGIKINSSPITGSSYEDLNLQPDTIYYYRISATSGALVTDPSNAVQVSAPKASAVDFGPNVFVMDSSMSSAAVQNICSTVFAKQESNQFGNERYALLFKPGTYSANIRVGFYTQVAGLGQSPNDVYLSGGIGVDAGWMSGNATCNFWRSGENFSAGYTKWAVSQAAPLRRVHVKGQLDLSDGGWSSGGFLADSVVDGNVAPGSQQQWFARNSQWNYWNNGVWNMVFVGDVNASSATWPAQPYTTVEKTPAVRESPYLTVDGEDNYVVIVPGLKKDSKGTSWLAGSSDGTSIPIDQFYIAHPDRDTSGTINAALDAGKNLLLTPGIYHLSDTIRVNKPNTIVLGLGFATLIPDNGIKAMTIADVDGVTVSGIVMDAGTANSPVLMEVGPDGSNKDHSSNPTLLSDVFFRVGGASLGQADLCLKINSNNVIGDDFWIWRADHGVDNSAVGWDINRAKNGLIVNGNDVTLYGLMVEHFQQYQTIWNGEGGKTYFYQSEMPYDIPDQASWMNGSIKGYASYKVADQVLSHDAYGLGAYSYFRDAEVEQNSAFEAPIAKDVVFHNVCTVFLNGKGDIAHVINNTGDKVNTAGQRAIVLNTKPPVIMLNGSGSISILQGIPYQDAGAVAADANGNNITDLIVRTVTDVNNNPVSFNSAVDGAYVFHYNVKDSTGNPAAEVTRTVMITPKSVYSLNYTAGAHGSVSGTTAQSVSRGGNGSKVTAIPDKGYYFVNWSDGVITPSRIEKSVNKDLSVTASFAQLTSVPCILTVHNGSGEGNYAVGTSVSVTANPDGTEKFIGWKNDFDQFVSYSRQFSFVITRNTSLTAVYGNPASITALPAVLLDEQALFETSSLDFVQIRILGTFVLPKDYIMENCGFVILPGNNINPNFDLNTSGAAIVPAVEINKAGQAYLVIRADYNAKFNIKGYMIGHNASGESFTLYSDKVVQAICNK